VGLFAIDSLAGSDRGMCDRLMQGVRRGDGNNIDVGRGDQLPPVAGRACEAELRSRRSRRFGRDVGDHLQDRGRHRREMAGDAAKGVGMATPHEAGADKADANRRNHLRHVSAFPNCRAQPPRPRQ